MNRNNQVKFVKNPITKTINGNLNIRKVTKNIIILFIFSLSVFKLHSQNYDKGDKMYAISWQNKYGYWFAAGPIQEIGAGEKTEIKALNLVIPSKLVSIENGVTTQEVDRNLFNYIKKVKTCGRYKVYYIARANYNYHSDYITRMKNDGKYTCSFP